MSIEAILTKCVVTVDMDDSLYTIRDIFSHVRFHHLLVTEDEKLCGIISDRDLLKAISPYTGSVAEQPRDAATLRKRAHQIMARNPVTISVGASAFPVCR